MIIQAIEQLRFSVVLAVDEPLLSVLDFFDDDPIPGITELDKSTNGNSKSNELIGAVYCLQKVSAKYLLLCYLRTYLS